MPYFRCRAVHVDQSEIDEIREAESLELAISNLQRDGYVPIRVVPAHTLSVRLLGAAGKRLKNREISIFTQELATLLQAGLPLDSALKSMLDLTEDVPSINAVIDLALQRIKQGIALSDALTEQDCGFSRFYIGILKAGEAGGDLGGSLQHLSDYLERLEALRSSVVSALVYPGILLFTSLASITLLMTLVLPQFAELFDLAGKELPAPTKFVMAIANGLRIYWWVLIALFILVAMLLQHVLRTPHLRYLWDSYCLTLPVVGELLKRIEVTRFSYTLGSLMSKGVPLLDALTMVKSTTVNSVMVEMIDAARLNLKQGRVMSGAFADDRKFPKMAIQMLRLGEETGNLQSVLDKMSATYDREVSAAMQRLLSLFEPILILVLGVMIAGIIFSVLMAVVSINDFVF